MLTGRRAAKVRRCYKRDCFRALHLDMTTKKKHRCPCGSGKRKKECCRNDRSARQLTPDEKLAMRKAAEALAIAGKHMEACEILENLAAISPRNPLIWNDLGVQYEAAGQLEKAFVALKHGYAVDRTYPPTLYNLGKLTLDHLINLHKAGAVTPHNAQEMLAAAIQFLNANLDRDPQNVDGHYYLSIAHALNEDERQAQAHMGVVRRLRDELATPLLG